MVDSHEVRKNKIQLIQLHFYQATLFLSSSFFYILDGREFHSSCPQKMKTFSFFLKKTFTLSRLKFLLIPVDLCKDAFGQRRKKRNFN
jgi:hypothetical protein